MPRVWRGTRQERWAAALFERALDLLIAEQKKRRFGIRPPRNSKGTIPQRSKATTQQSSKVATQQRSKVATPHSPNAAIPKSSSAQTPILAAQATAASQLKRSRYMPARVKREVAERDELRCTYEDSDGERCTECRFLEFEHSVPYARGGQSDSETLRLLCRGHNQLMARREFGSEHIERAIETRRTRARRKHKLGP